MKRADTSLPGRCPNSAVSRGDQSLLAGRHATKQAAVEDAVARCFYANVSNLAAAAIAAIDAWEKEQGGRHVA